jgi:hypothetical protein
VREDGRIVGGEEWQEKVYHRAEWKKLLRTARNRRILHMPIESLNSFFWDIKQCMVVIPNQNFGTTYWSHLQGSKNPRRKLLTLSMQFMLVKMWEVISSH